MKINTLIHIVFKSTLNIKDFVRQTELATQFNFLSYLVELHEYHLTSQVPGLDINASPIAQG